MDTQNETEDTEHFKAYLSKALFKDGGNFAEKATWQDILDEVLALVNTYDEIKKTFKKIKKEFDPVDFHGQSLANQAGIILRNMREFQETIDDRESKIEELLEEIQTADQSQVAREVLSANQSRVAREVLSDLGFDIWKLTPANNILDFTKPGLVEEMKRQMEKMR